METTNLQEEFTKLPLIMLLQSPYFYILGDFKLPNTFIMIPDQIQIMFVLIAYMEIMGFSKDRFHQMCGSLFNLQVVTGGKKSAKHHYLVLITTILF